jgi:trans-aconitate 2-methyltransferase
VAAAGQTSTTNAAPEGAGRVENRGVARYTFGDDVPAVQRLALVASAYESVSRSFLAQQSPADVDVALDLGCGPGFSTQLVDDVCAPRTLIGLDSSPQFLDEARARLPAARFDTHDVTVTPLPGAPARVIYARLLLAHLPDPLGIAERWRTSLVPGGVLLIEDLERIEAPPGPLRTYDEVSADIVRGGGGLMYAGPALARHGGRCTAVSVPAALAATIYLLNVRRWLAEPKPRVPQRQLEDLEAGLGTIARDDGSEMVSWIVRQLVIPA